MKKCAGFTGVLLVCRCVGSRHCASDLLSFRTSPIHNRILRTNPAALIDVTVSEGTSMSVAVSPDGKTLAMDMQGSIWTLPASGGTAKRITGLFNDARQPVWSPDGKWITFFGYLRWWL